ncbi:MAG: hypothetical protein ABIP75_09425 [Pyrinomonadaceae bacterium]
MKKLDRREWLVVLALIVCVGLGVFFIMRAVKPIVYWNLHRDEPIRSWMTIDYVAHSYHVPPHVLYQPLGMPHRPPDRRSIHAIAKAQDRTDGEVIAILQNAIVHARPPYPPPPPPTPEPGAAP